MSTVEIETPQPIPIQLTTTTNAERAISFRIPAYAMNFEGFLEWKDSDEYPEYGRITWLNGGLIIDMNAENGETHSRLKGSIHATLHQLVKRNDLGLLYPDGFSLLNYETGWTTTPDGMFITWETYESKKAEFRKNRKEHLTGVYGSPDWVLEVVSDSSEKEDREEFKMIYESIGIREYWVIDGRSEPMVMEIYTLTANGYQAVPVTNGTWQSPLFQRQFHLGRTTGRHGFWNYEFEGV